MQLITSGLLGVAQLGSIWNLPVFSWVSDLLDFKEKDKYTTLVRLSGPLYYFGKSSNIISMGESEKGLSASLLIYT